MVNIYGDPFRPLRIGLFPLQMDDTSWFINGGPILLTTYPWTRPGSPFHIRHLSGSLEQLEKVQLLGRQEETGGKSRREWIAMIPWVGTAGGKRAGGFLQNLIMS